MSEKYNPYNPCNVAVCAADVEQILVNYGLGQVMPKVRNMQYFKRAFVHESYTKAGVADKLADLQRLSGGGPPLSMDDEGANIPLSSKSNQRLEFLGDGILEAVVKFWVYRNFPRASSSQSSGKKYTDEGFMTDIKMAMVCNKAIGRVAIEMGINRWLLVDRNLEPSIRNNEEKMGCLFEAFIGALYLDANSLTIDDEEGWFESGLFLTGPGFQVVQLFLEHVFERHYDRVKLVVEKPNHKRTLQEMVQKIFKVTPTYVVEEQPVKKAGSVSDATTWSGKYRMGVYVCVGQSDHGLTRADSTPMVLTTEGLAKWAADNGYGETDEKRRGFFFLGEGTHFKKQEAEQQACKSVLESLGLVIT